MHLTAHRLSVKLVPKQNGGVVHFDGVGVENGLAVVPFFPVHLVYGPQDISGSVRSSQFALKEEDERVKTRPDIDAGRPPIVAPEARLQRVTKRDAPTQWLARGQHVDFYASVGVVAPGDPLNWRLNRLPVPPGDVGVYVQVAELE
jgi:hypothetical protein